MDPNTLNLKTQQTPSLGNIPTIQSGSIAQFSSTPAQSSGAGPADATLPPLTAEETTILDETQKELRTRYELLPSKIQETIISSEYQSTLFELAKKYKITYVDLGQLELETTMVLLGMTPPEELAESMAEVIKKDRMTVIDPLVKEIDTQIFAKIREQLVDLYDTSSAPANIPPATVVPLAQELVSKPPATLAIDDTAVGGISFAKTTTVPIQVASTPVASPMPQTPVLEKHEDDALKNSGIEIGTAPFHTETTPKDSFTSKLTGVFGVKSTSTDHTLPKMAGDMSAPQATKTPGVDPYREIV